MKTTFIFRGGLGNQMFEYAMALALRNGGHKVNIDTSMYEQVEMHNGYELDRVFGIKEPVICKRGWHLFKLRFISRFLSNKIISEDTLVYDPTVLLSPKPYINGYWQDERYFKDIESEIRKTFQFKGVDEKNMKIADEMHSCNSVSLHIRRGDYAAYGMTLIGKDYYQKAIEYIMKKVETPMFYIFSDDKEESMNIIANLGIKYIFIDGNNGKDSYKDMFLMSQCSHNIIANSSFSWWGAWLNSNPIKIVVAPFLWSKRRTNFHPQVKTWILH